MSELERYRDEIAVARAGMLGARQWDVAAQREVVEQQRALMAEFLAVGALAREVGTALSKRSVTPTHTFTKSVSGPRNWRGKEGPPRTEVVLAGWLIGLSRGGSARWETYQQEAIVLDGDGHGSIIGVVNSMDQQRPWLDRGSYSAWDPWTANSLEVSSPLPDLFASATYLDRLNPAPYGDKSSMVSGMRSKLIGLAAQYEL